MIFKPFQSFTTGFLLPLEAGKLIIKKPSLIIWSLIPVILTLLVYVYFVSDLQDYTRDHIGLWLSRFGLDPAGLFYRLVMICSRVLIWLLAALTFSFTSTMIASPFNDFLAETSEKFVTPQLPPTVSLGWRGKLRLIMIDLAKTGASILATLFAFLLALIPVVNLVAFILALLLITFQYTSYPQTRRGVRLKDGILFLFKNLFICCGFGLGVSFLFSIPFISSLALPLAVVGGTLLVARQQLPIQTS